jgi:serine/threonine protein phosphatase 1
MKQFVIGDIHGQAEALKECLMLSGFDRNNDRLICLGDVCDNGPDVKQCFDILLGIKDLIYLKGNHDMWFLNWALKKDDDDFWQNILGAATINSYNGNNVTAEHIELINNGYEYYLSDNKLFVHGGIIPYEDLDKQTDKIFLWDRDLVEEAYEYKDDKSVERITQFDEVYVGHTPVTTKPFNEETPLYLKGVWMMDTGAGVGKRLTIMDIASKNFWQSDKVQRVK